VGKGIEVFRASRDQIAVVLLDVATAGAASEEGLRELEKIKPNVSVVLSTDFGEGEARRRFGGHQLAGFLQKPYSMRMLAERLHEAAAGVACRQP
jgi:DNA-binding NarL/FixJ family response regulator